jgi:hypothetical protein
MMRKPIDSDSADPIHRGRGFPCPPGWILGLALPVICGCAEWGKPRPTLPEPYQVVRGPLIVHSDSLRPTQPQLVDELAARREDLCRQLALSIPEEPVEIYLFGQAEAFRRFMNLHYPELPDRRAFFIEADHQPVVYAQCGDRLPEDLRHELTHAYLHAAVPQIPLWLDEGLAVYYETPRSSGGLNRKYLEWFANRLAAGLWQPDLARLEQLPPTTDMGRGDYAEAWAWVHFLLHSAAERGDLLRGYLSQLRRAGDAEPLSRQLRRGLERPEAALGDYVRALVSRRGPG